jgi:hypothetical protein
VAGSGALASIAACALLLLLAGCERADADYASCTSKVQEAIRDASLQETETEAIRRCMAGKGWRALRPSLPPGSNAWARVVR